jgi:CheY-like chemotaxis protein
MDGDGTLTLRTRFADDDAATVLVEIEDTGAGMSEEVRRRAFDPFFTTKAGGGGTGLGLAMVFATVDRAKGRIEVVSAPGRGTRITLRLPVIVTDDPSAAPIVETPSFSAPRVVRILYVEDEPALVRMTARALGRAGHHVDIATSATAGLERLEHGPLPDLLLTDARLPDGSSAPVITEFRRRSPRGPVILCSGYVEDDVVVGGIERDSVIFLQKPFGITQLLETIENAIT